MKSRKNTAVYLVLFILFIGVVGRWGYNYYLADLDGKNTSETTVNITNSDSEIEEQKIYEENYGDSKDTTKVLKLTENELQFDAVSVTFSGDYKNMFTSGQSYPYYLDSASGGQRGINVKDNSGIWRTFAYREKLQ